MPIATKETRAQCEFGLRNFVNLFLDMWLFQSNRKFAPACRGARQIRKGMLIETGVGDIVVEITTIDKDAGLLEYAMVTDLDRLAEFNSGHDFGPTKLKHYRGTVNITEAPQEEDGENGAGDNAKLNNYLVHWTIDFKLKLMVTLPTFGLGALAFQDLQKEYMKSTLKLLKRTGPTMKKEMLRSSNSTSENERSGNRRPGNGRSGRGRSRNAGSENAAGAADDGDGSAPPPADANAESMARANDVAATATIV